MGEGTDGGTMEQARDRARSLVDRYWEELLELEPILGTEVGDERFDDRLPDPTESGLAERERIQRRALAEVEAIDRATLDPSLRTTLDVLEAIARRDLDAIEHRFDRFGVANHMWGPGALLAQIASLQRADTPERLDRYEARLRAFPEYLAALADVAEEAAGAGQTVPGLVADRAIAQLERLIASDQKDSPALAPLGPDSRGGRDRIVAVMAGEVIPAYGRYLETLRAYRTAATETLGLSSLPNGPAMYDAQIRAWTTLPLSADEVHRTGVEDLARIQEERHAIAGALGFADAAAATRAHQAGGGNAASSREELIRLAEEQVRRGWEAAPGFFGRLPTANCEVRPVEEYREADMPFAYYQSPSADNSRPGVYYVNTSDLPDRPLHHLACTTYHEANPGHHFQVAIEQELEDRPSLRRFGGILAGSAFAEGWGLYSERLADEMRLYEDEYERLGMLDAQAWRAARLVVDTGIHALGWDRDRAIHTLEEAGVPPVDAVIETDRYIAIPGQALAYKIGHLAIERWRAEATDREGPAFSLRGFHDRLLALGTLPLSAVERELARAAV
jgi:uncharacterized protein (DUF885 family)